MQGATRLDYSIGSRVLRRRNGSTSDPMKSGDGTSERRGDAQPIRETSAGAGATPGFHESTVASTALRRFQSVPFYQACTTAGFLGSRVRTRRSGHHVADDLDDRYWFPRRRNREVDSFRGE